MTMSCFLQVVYENVFFSSNVVLCMFLDLQYIKKQVFGSTIHKVAGLWTCNT